MVESWSLAHREGASSIPSSPQFDDLGSLFLDSFPDFDPVKEWLVDPDHNPMPGEDPKQQDPDGSDPKMVESELPKEELGQNSLNPDGFGARMIDLGVQNKILGSTIDEKMEMISVVECSRAESALEESGQDSLNPDGLGSRRVELGLQNENLGSPIDEKMEKVRLVEGSYVSMEVSSIFVLTNGNGDGIALDSSISGEERNGSNHSFMEGEKGGVCEICSVSDSIKVAHDSSEESSETLTDGSESDDFLSNSSSSSDEEKDEDKDEEEEEDDEDDEESKGREDEIVVFEEGEIRDDDREMVVFCSDEKEEVPKGPIKSKHETEDLPPVPRVEVFLEPHNRMLPLGVISSIMGNRVIVEGSVKHNPLNEGSILWITETRSQLGLVDEIFGPVKNPFYIIRYNSDNEVPAGITVGTSVSFVMEFASHILNEKDLYRKGYDASGDNDEEFTEEMEFSDDEKEAEYRRSLRQSKRATHVNQQHDIGKKRTNFKGKQTLQVPTNPPSAAAMGQPPSLPGHPGHLQAPPAKGNFGCGSSSCSHGAENPSVSAPLPMVPAIPQAFQMGNCSLGAVNPGASAPSPTVPIIPQAFQIGNCSLGAGNPGASVPFPAVPAIPQAFQMGGSCFVDPSQQLNAVWAQGFQPQPQQQGGGFPMNWLPTQQFGNQNYNLHHQNQVFNYFASGIIPYQQQQFVPNVVAQPNYMPWLGGPVNISVEPSALVGPMGPGGFGQVPFGSGNVNAPGTLGLCSDQSLGPMGPGGFGQVPFGSGNVSALGTLGSCSDQSHGQPPSPPAVQGEMNPPLMQFNPGRPSFWRRRPYQRGGRHSFGGRGGRR